MLASIQEVKEVIPIKDADKIELVKILGWQVVTIKDQFKPEDKCIYIEIDSLLPDDNPNFEFLRKNNFRIKTLKLRGELSQGICFPLSILPPGNYKLGDDVTDILNIKHYEKPIPAQLAGQIRGAFPGYVPKTDEIKIQSIPFLIDELKGIEVYSTVKLDGTSGSYIYYNDDFHICSRNLSLKINEENKENSFIKINEKYNIYEKLKEKGNYCIQGEICGPGIQKNKLNLKEIDFFMFNIFDIDNQTFLDLDDLILWSQELDIPMVPIEEYCEFNFTMNELLEKSKGFYSNTRNRREGLVYRTVTETIFDALKGITVKGRVSFKVLNNDYLLKEEE